MKMDDMARSVAEAEAQQFILPDRFSDKWRSFAMLINGYAIAEELGFDLHSWGAEQERRFKESGSWNLSVLECG